MDPLTIIGTTIAISQAGDRSLVLLSKLKRLREAPDEVSRLMNDISSLKLVLGGFQTFLRQMQDSSLWDQDDISDLATVANELSRQSLGLEQILYYTLLDPAGKVRRLGWATNQGRIESARHRLRDAMSNATTQLGRINA